MRPNTNKPKTAKAGRRFRGLEVAQAALLLVLGVVVALAMYFTMMNMLASAPVPEVQLDPYSTAVYNNFAGLALIFGKPATVNNVEVVDRNANLIATCTPGFGLSYPLRVAPGQKYIFKCELVVSTVSWPRYAVVRVWFAGDQNNRVALNWVIS